MIADRTLPTAIAASPPPQAAAIPQTTAPMGARAVFWLLVGLGFATGMEFYSFDFVNLVLPDLTASLGVSGDEASWILTTYSSSLFLGVPISIWLAGHVGYKRYLIATILLFAVASIGCAAAPDLPIMLTWRAVAGFAGAGLVVWW
jgi:MFS transporter, DHA2 family, multidrug resistance protein